MSRISRKEVVRKRAGEWRRKALFMVTVAMLLIGLLYHPARAGGSCSPEGFPAVIEGVDASGTVQGGVNVKLHWLDVSPLQDVVYLLARNQVSGVVSSMQISPRPAADPTFVETLPNVLDRVSEHGLQYRFVVEDDAGNPLSESYPVFLTPTAGGTQCRYGIPRNISADILLLSPALDQLLDQFPSYCQLEDALQSVLGAHPALRCEIEGLLTHLGLFSLDPNEFVDSEGPGGSVCYSACTFLWQAVVDEGPGSDRIQEIVPELPSCEDGFIEYLRTSGSPHCMSAQAVGQPGSSTLQKLRRTAGDNIQVEIEARRWSGDASCALACAAQVVFRGTHAASLNVLAEALEVGGSASAEASEQVRFSVNGVRCIDSLLERTVDTLQLPYNEDMIDLVKSCAMPPMALPATGTLDLSGEVNLEAQGSAWAFAEVNNLGFRIEAEAKAQCLAFPEAHVKLLAPLGNEPTKINKWR